MSDIKLLPHHLPVPMTSFGFSVGCWVHSCSAEPVTEGRVLHPPGCIPAVPRSNYPSVRCRARPGGSFCAFYPQVKWASTMVRAQSWWWLRWAPPPPLTGSHSWRQGWASHVRKDWRQGWGWGTQGISHGMWRGPAGEGRGAPCPTHHHHPPYPSSWEWWVLGRLQERWWLFGY